MASLIENIQKRLIERDGLRVNLKSIPDANTELGVSTSEADLTNIQVQSENSLLDASDIEQFTQLSKYRDERYQAFEEMLKDPIIAAALEMYADDATQYNTEGNIIWAESDDKVVSEAANRLLRVLGIQENAWRHIYSLCTYGDLYLRLYKDGDEPDNMDYSDSDTSDLQIIPEDKTRKLEERVEYVNNPATVFDLQEKDKTTAFVKTKSNIVSDNSIINHNYIGVNNFSTYVSSISSRNCEMLYNKAFVHIMLSESVNRNPEFLSIDTDDNTTNVYKIKTGKSILEDAYPVTKRLDLLQDSLLLNRLSKSAIIRILQIETGDAPKPEAENILRRVKNLIEQKMSANTETGRARSYNSPGPIENTIYVPTKNGKGAITTDTIGGDANVKDIVDIEYFQNLKLAALKIPKQYLNFDSAEGFSNGQSLTRVSSRYSHTIMRIQSAYIRGITNLLNIFFIDKGLDYVNKFKIRMVNPSTVEDAERHEVLNDKIGQTRDILDLVRDAGVDEDTTRQILCKMINTFVGLPEVSELVNNSLKNKDPEEDTDDEEFSDISDEFDEFDADLSDAGFEDAGLDVPESDFNEEPDLNI